MTPSLYEPAGVTPGGVHPLFVSRKPDHHAREENCQQPKWLSPFGSLNQLAVPTSCWFCLSRQPRWNQNLSVHPPHLLSGPSGFFEVVDGIQIATCRTDHMLTAGRRNNRPQRGVVGCILTLNWEPHGIGLNFC